MGSGRGDRKGAPGLGHTVVSVGLCVLAAALIGYSALHSGGYDPKDFLVVGVLAFVAAGGGLIVVAGRWRPSGATSVALSGLLGLAAWTGVSSAWSPDPGGADIAMQRCLTYAAMYLLFAVAVGNGRHAGLLLRLVVAVLVGVCIVALLSRLRPALIGTDPGLLAIAQGRLAHPLGYWNALGGVAAMAIIGCTGLAADAREHAALRCLCASGGAIGVWTLHLTISRGAGLALVAAFVVVLLTSARRLRLAVSGGVIVGAGAIGVAVLHAHPVLVDRPGPLSEQARAGGRVLVVLVVLAMAAGAVQLVLTRMGRLNQDRESSRARGRNGMPPIGAYAIPVTLVLVLLVGVYATSSDTVEGQAADGTVSLRSFVDRQYDAFMDTAKPPPVGQERLKTVRSSRSDAYRVAIDGLQHNPLAGDGAAGYQVRWMRDRKVPESFRNAHSLELETASELGLVGILLLAGVLLPFAGGLRRLRTTGGGLTRSQAAAAGGMLVVWAGHSALDWDWQMPAVTLPALACGAILLAQGRPRGRAHGSSSRSPNPSGP